MPRLNPNEPDAYTIMGDGALKGSTFGRFSSWNLPRSIRTPYGVAVLRGTFFVVSATVYLLDGAYHHAVCPILTDRCTPILSHNLPAESQACTLCKPGLSIILARVVPTGEPQAWATRYHQVQY